MASPAGFLSPNCEVATHPLEINNLCRNSLACSLVAAIILTLPALSPWIKLR
ncbi:MAG: hypothetical protein SGI90_17170 [Candidatus Eisenbacteria bacterium]|nr:hypothetical protein [Candidatus Eisenbacteria bacterium]